MAYITMKQMLETGVHFGHQTRRWNPKMRPYIFGSRNGIHIIDLQQTVKLFQVAHDFIVDTVARGGKVLFVGTKRQAQDAIKAEAERCEMFFVTNRWMGGTLTNFQTIKKSIDRLKKLEAMFEDGSIDKFPKKEIVLMEREVNKLNNALGGIKDLAGPPAAAFIVDPKREHIAIQECRKLSIPVVAVVDTNCDPDVIDYIIPGNDDAIRAIKLFAQHVADACLEGLALHGEEQARAAAEAEAEAKAAEAAEKAEKAKAAAEKADREEKAKKDEPKKAEPKKEEAKKPAPKKAAPKKAAPKKPAPKKDEPAKPAPMPEPKKDAKPEPKEAKAEPKEAKAEPKEAKAKPEKAPEAETEK